MHLFTGFERGREGGGLRRELGVGEGMRMRERGKERNIDNGKRKRDQERVRERK